MAPKDLNPEARRLMGLETQILALCQIAGVDCETQIKNYEKGLCLEIGPIMDTGVRRDIIAAVHGGPLHLGDEYRFLVITEPSLFWDLEWRKSQEGMCLFDVAFKAVEELVKARLLGWIGSRRQMNAFR